MTNEKNALKWSLDTNYSPIRYSTMESNDYLDICSETDKEKYSADMVKARVFSYVATSEVSNSLFTSPVFKGSDVARTQVGSIITTVFTNTDATTDAALDTLVKTEFAKAENTIKTKMN